MATAQRATLHATGVMPSLTVNRLQDSLNFFSGLGFEVEEKWEEKGALTGVMLKAGNARLGLSQDDGKKGRDRMKGVGMRLYIEAKDNIDEVAARAKAAGITLKSEPHDTDWGNRAFEVEEPSGFLLTIESPSSPSK
ncbi:MAG TPA: VOC family protein [Vicinamibacterales bacterium]|nr:VOC family protein [Vicinamibacterales bacterium]